MEKSHKPGPALRWLIWLGFLVAWTVALLVPIPDAPMPVGEGPDLKWLIGKPLHVSAYAFLTVLAAWLGLPWWPLVAASLLALATALALAELFVARLDLDEDALRIRGLCGTKVYPYSEIADVKIERPSLAIRLAHGQWRRLPGWMGVNLTARRQIGRRIAPRRPTFRDLEPSSAG